MANSSIPSKKFSFLLQLLCMALFIGRAWQHFRWSTPYDAFFFDPANEGLMSFLSGMDWTTFLTSESTFVFLKYFQQGIGGFYLFMAFFVLALKKSWPLWLSRGLLFFSSGLLFLLALLYTKNQYFQLGQLLEYSVQCSLPLLLYYSVFFGLSSRLLFWGRLALAATFVGHGLYAIGYYPQPGHFVQMFLSVLGCSETSAQQLLQLIGALDFVAAIGLFIPRIEKYALYYCISWGLITAIARLVANFYLDFYLESLDQWGWEVLVRLGHGGLGIGLYIAMRAYKKAQIFS